MAVIESALQVVAPSGTRSLQAYETWADRFLVPRIRVTPGTTPATLLGWLG